MRLDLAVIVAVIVTVMAFLIFVMAFLIFAMPVRLASTVKCRLPTLLPFGLVYLSALSNTTNSRATPPSPSVSGDGGR